MSDRAGRPDPRLLIFGAHLRQLREQSGLTLEQVADAAGIAGRQLGRVEAGRASPSLLWLVDVAAGLGVGIDVLVAPLADVSRPAS